MTGLLRGRNFLPLRDMKSSYDVVIIGGGVQGLSTAYYLAAHHGIKNIAVLERAYIGAGASGRNTQVVRSNYNTPETIPFYKESLQMYSTLAQELDFNLMFSNQGEIDLVHTDDSWRVENDKCLLNQRMGVDTHMLTPSEILEVCPHIDLSGGGKFPVIGASYHPPCSFVRHDAVVWGYASAAASRGVHIHEQTRVTGIEVDGGTCRGCGHGPRPDRRRSRALRGGWMEQRDRRDGGSEAPDRDPSPPGVCHRAGQACNQRSGVFVRRDGLHLADPAR